MVEHIVYSVNWGYAASMSRTLSLKSEPNAALKLKICYKAVKARYVRVVDW